MKTESRQTNKKFCSLRVLPASFAHQPWRCSRSETCHPYNQTELISIVAFSSEKRGFSMFRLPTFIQGPHGNVAVFIHGVGGASARPCPAIQTAQYHRRFASLPRTQQSTINPRWLLPPPLQSFACWQRRMQAAHEKAAYVLNGLTSSVLCSWSCW